MAVIIPSFVRGPGNAVNVTNCSAPIATVTESGNTVTATTTIAHALTSGQIVSITGVASTKYDGTFTVLTTPTAKTFTYSDSAGTSMSASSGGAVSLPTGIPISLSDTGGVASGTFTFNYNPQDLTINPINGVTVDPGLNGSGATLTILSATALCLRRKTS